MLGEAIRFWSVDFSVVLKSVFLQIMMSKHKYILSATIQYIGY